MTLQFSFKIMRTSLFDITIEMNAWPLVGWLEEWEALCFHIGWMHGLFNENWSIRFTCMIPQTEMYQPRALSKEKSDKSLSVWTSMCRNCKVCIETNDRNFILWWTLNALMRTHSHVNTSFDTCLHIDTPMSPSSGNFMHFWKHELLCKAGLSRNEKQCWVFGKDILIYPVLTSTNEILLFISRIKSPTVKMAMTGIYGRRTKYLLAVLNFNITFL